MGKLPKLKAKVPIGAKVSERFKYKIILHGTMKNITGLKTRYWQGWFSSQSSKGQVFSLLCLVSIHHWPFFFFFLFWLIVPFLHLQNHHRKAESFPCCYLWLFLLPPSSKFKDSCANVGLYQIIQNQLSSNLKSTYNPNFLLLCILIFWGCHTKYHKQVG